jgi:hypothetical protein
VAGGTGGGGTEEEKEEEEECTKLRRQGRSPSTVEFLLHFFFLEFSFSFLSSLSLHLLLRSFLRLFVSFFFVS